MPTEHDDLIEKLKPAFAADRQRDERIARAAVRRVRDKIVAGEVAPARGWDWGWLISGLRPAVALTAACALAIIALSWFATGRATNATSSVYVSFAAEQTGRGTADRPFNSLERGTTQVKPGGTLNVKSGATAQPIRIEKPMRLVAVDGQVRIGKL
ncbi:MAG: hypothetical protein ABFD69_16520 [Candidatus Sumerlaeia bacterium]